jgi:hypothetical protein
MSKPDDFPALDLSDVPGVVRTLRSLNLAVRLLATAALLRGGDEPVTLQSLADGLVRGTDSACRNADAPLQRLAALDLPEALRDAPAALRRLGEDQERRLRVDAALAADRPVFDQLAAAVLELTGTAG